MKNIKTIILTAVAVISSACTVEELSRTNDIEAGGEMKELVFTASSPVKDSDTKAGISNFNVFWYAGDQIAVSGADGVPFTSDLKSGTAATVNFSGTAEVSRNYYAFSPISAMSDPEGFTAGNSSVKATLPEVQINEGSGFDSQAIIMTSSTSDTDKSFSFGHVPAYIKFTVSETSAAFSMLRITAPDGTALTGDIEVNCETQNFSVTSGKSGVEFYSGDQTTFGQGDFYIAVLPGNFSQGLKFTFYNTASDESSEPVITEYEFSKTDNLTLSAGAVYSIGTIPADLSDTGSGDSGSGTSEDVLWEGSWDFSTSYDFTELTGDKWENISVSEGSERTYLVAEIEPTSEYIDYYMMFNNGYDRIAGYSLQNYPTVIETEISDALLTEIKSRGGIVISGDNFILKKIYLKQESYSGYENLRSGDPSLTEGYTNIESFYFNSLPESCTLHMDLYPVSDSGTEPCIDWGTDRYYLSSYIYHISRPLSSSEVEELKMSGLNINYSDVTIDTIYYTY